MSLSTKTLASFLLLFCGCSHVGSIMTVKSLHMDSLLFVDSKASESNKRPLVVLLHGCDQTAKEFEDLTRFKQLAATKNFALLSIEQSRARNRSGCFNWFVESNQLALPSSETDAVQRLVQQTLLDPRLDNKRVYVVGLSAGGAMSGILLTCFSDVFTAGAIHSSPSYLRATGVVDALTLMTRGPENRPVRPNKCGGFKRAKMIVIQGDKDKTVVPSNAKVLMDDLADVSESKLILQGGLDHAWSGGAPGHKYSAPSFLSATDQILAFFKL